VVGAPKGIDNFAFYSKMIVSLFVQGAAEVFAVSMGTMAASVPGPGMRIVLVCIDL